MKKILILSANPKNTDKLRIEEEEREIDEGLRRSRHRDQFDLTSKWAVRSRDFYRHMLDIQPHVVHFSGHGGGENGIVLEDEMGKAQFLPTDQLTGLFKLFASKGVECVLLNACYSKVQAEAISQHVNYVIGMNQAIGDKAAINFSVAFYDALGAGESVEFAYELGCTQLIGSGGHEIPVLLRKSETSTSGPVTSATASSPTTVFFSYAHEDEELRNELAKHLKMLKRQGIITDWYDRDITAGSDWANQISQHLEAAEVILLLVSADFLASDYCFEIEMMRAMERHEAGKACVIPVILREVDWKGAPFSKLQALPHNAKPVADWTSRDQAFTDIAKGIRRAIESRKNRASVL